MARRSDHTREELQLMALEAAEHLLDKQGIGALSTRKVASAIGYSAGALYLVFKNLDDLCWQINARTLAALQSQLDALPHGEAADVCLRAYAHCYLDFARQWPHRWALLFEHSAPEGDDAPAWLNCAIQQLFERLEARLSEIGPSRERAAVQLGSRTLWSAVHGITQLTLRDKLFLAGTAGPEAMVDNLVNCYLDGWQSDARGA